MFDDSYGMLSPKATYICDGCGTTKKFNANRVPIMDCDKMITALGWDCRVKLKSEKIPGGTIERNIALHYCKLCRLIY